ncbi:TetR family transcriptional regulator [Rhizobium sp. Leaf384]|uniref:TetR family transcriptional regulator n=1 Tax=unclassified Rhizobium TaxID=2613769 RepID=UPI0007139374|nr:MULTISPECIES: TetR family transcriptional regulator [unclassified Rhizobium]KQR72885.1 TetR family transcriptional regulator [Rhizobium sp. Leaf341]KQS75527.1 TetR family transcriptional regulator [Rhizobium sp. Leaf384]KQS75776.1 TetR family transcriptional regulator [Rhizobium sp. Leaf383]
MDMDTTEAARQDGVMRILDAAEKLFRHYGYGKTTVADIARDLGMSTANIYRFFASKVEIHQALCSRMLGASYDLAQRIAALPLSASERLRRYTLEQHSLTMETMLDEEKVHEMVIVAIERDWHVIERHIDRVNDLMAEIIAEGIASGEFREQDPHVAAKCFGAATVMLCHPQMVAQCVAKENRAQPEDLVAFAIEALKP